MTLFDSISIPEDLFIVSKSRAVTDKIISTIMDANSDVPTEVFDFKEYTAPNNKETKLVVLKNYDVSLSYAVRMRMLESKTTSVRVIVISDAIDDNAMTNFKAHLLCKIEDTSEALLIRGISVDKVAIS